MNRIRIRTGGLVVAIGLMTVSPMAMAQDGRFDHKFGGKVSDLGAARADAYARANNDARLKNTTTNKAQQAQSAKAIGQGGSSFADVTVKNHNSATTGPISNTNINTNFSENNLINKNSTARPSAPFLRAVK